jgi:hypothetical protein
MLLPPLLVASLITTTPDGGLVTVKGRQLLAEVARTEKERERGLAYRSSFKPERCLFVVPGHEGPNPVRTAKFLLPFDVIWVDAEGIVVEVEERVPPCQTGKDCIKHGGTKPSSYYLFLALGTVQRLRIQPGDKIQWDLHFSDGTNLRNGPHVHAKPKGNNP